MFGRRTSAEEAASRTDASVELKVSRVGSKGKPTPKRKEAEAYRKQRNAPPRSRKEANALQRERSREQRLKQKAAMASGDPRFLPARDQGEVKKFIRDYVDSHRTIGEFLIPIFLVIFVLVYLPGAAALGSVAWIVVLAAVLFDSLRILRGIRSGISSRFGEGQTKGVTMYTLMRSWQMRRLRLPKPQVKHGQPV
ncbi:MAG: DUF3043 domain-containing protein [Nocardioidaceae bacterium]